MKLFYTLLALCMVQLQAADKQPKEFDLRVVSVYPLARSSERAGECSKLWYDTLGKKNHPDYEKIRESHTAFIASHAQDNQLPIMYVALLNEKVIGMGALRATCYPRKDEVAWADEHPEYTPWLAGFCIGKEHQKKGVGKKIAIMLLRHALMLGHREAYLHSEDEANQKLYEKKGAVKVADVIRDDKKNNRQVSGICLQG